MMDFLFVLGCTLLPLLGFAYRFKPSLFPQLPPLTTRKRDVIAILAVAPFMFVQGIRFLDGAISELGTELSQWLAIALIAAAGCSLGIALREFSPAWNRDKA